MGGTGNGNTLLHIHADGRFEQKGGVNSDNGPALLVFNDGNNTNRKGLGIVCGTDDASGTNIAAFFDSGNSTGQGSITFSGGTVTYGAFTAHHEISLPDDDKSKGYDYGTLLDIDQIYYAKDRDGTNQERGIRYLVKKSSSAYSKKVLGAYCGDLLELADKDFIIAFSKADLMDHELLEEFKIILKQEFKDIKYHIISSVSNFGINEIKENLWNKLNQKN